MRVTLGFSNDFLILFDCFFGLAIAIRVSKQSNTTDDSGV